MMELLEGPSCPECGYKGSEVCGRGARSIRLPDGKVEYKQRERRECGRCGKRWWRTVGDPWDGEPIDADECVRYVPMRTECPDCGTFSPVTRTISENLRQHRCANAECGHCFKSMEG